MERYIQDLKFVLLSLTFIVAAFVILGGLSLLIYNSPLLGGTCFILSLPLLIRVVDR